MRHNLFVPNKMPYAKGKNRPDVPCILCAIVEKMIKSNDLKSIEPNALPYRLISILTVQDIS